ncbi:MAG: hypothetical protein ACYS0K_11270 [Planctomycetota bacterium]|jgi:hypothetical protein
MHDDQVLGRAREFLVRDARLLERRLFEYHFDNGSGDAVIVALRAFQNRDGGFGHGLEPDLRAPASQPIHVEIALQALRDTDVRDSDLAARACAFLEGVAGPDGAVSPALPGAADYPCASHFELDWAVTPDVNPTAAIAGHLHALGVEHPWLDRATAWCLRAIEERTFQSAHTLKAALLLVEGRPALLERVMGQFANAEWFTLDVPVREYTLTPLHVAPTPDAPARAFFTDDVIEAHLDDLIERQQEDGGWPIHWEAPGPAAVCEWRGRWTLDALLALRAYGRI